MESVSRAARPAAVSMTDVARHAGVSLKTVSRVVNAEQHVSGAVRETVQRAIEELGYQPNGAARALASKRTKRIGMIAASTSFSGPSAILDGVEKAVRQQGYSLALVRTQPDEGYEIQHAIAQLISQGIDGLILSQPVGPDNPGIQGPAGVPLLSIDYPDARHSAGEIVVGTDEVDGARQAVNHLLSLGHRTVWHLGGDPAWAAARQRTRGWRETLEAAGASVPEPVFGDWTAASGYAQMQKMLDAGSPTAVFVANDQMAIGAIHALERSGRSIPGDVSVVGFDDADESAFLHIPLTTIRADFQDTAHQGVLRLIESINGRDEAPRQFTLPVHLVIRESTAPPRNAG
ncbi:LacI family DNA-binding transcriptional regulator [Arthrobacter sp. G.S.26]|uniref:LacI family DNA-binding transcriptional regulator n=1 Tax=Arthrobacter sp. G.S.26 TaxID=3433706 RepID=UPI003D7788E2